MDCNNKVSVIIANYNNATYLDECINSVLSQTYSNVEIVIVDDCSTDCSRSKITEMAKRYENIIPVFNEKNVGVSATRDIGIKESTGKFVTTLDADDFYINKNKIASELKAFFDYLQIKNQYPVVYSDIIRVDENSYRRSQENNVEFNELNKKNFLNRKCFIPRDMLFLKQMYFYVGGFDPQFKMYEDWDLKIRLISQYPFVYSDTEGTAYRFNSTGLSRKKRKIHNYWQYKVLEKNLSKMSNYKKLVSYYYFVRRILISALKSRAKVFLNKN